MALLNYIASAATMMTSTGSTGRHGQVSFLATAILFLTHIPTFEHSTTQFTSWKQKSQRINFSWYLKHIHISRHGPQMIPAAIRTFQIAALDLQLNECTMEGFRLRHGATRFCARIELSVHLLHTWEKEALSALLLRNRCIDGKMSDEQECSG